MMLALVIPAWGDWLADHMLKKSALEQWAKPGRGHHQHLPTMMHQKAYFLFLL